MNRKQVVSGMVWGLVVCGLLLWSCFTPIATESSQPTSVVPDAKKVSGLWVATTNRLDFPSAVDLSAEQLKAQIDAIMQDAAQWGMNTVVFQVRPACDALYDSSLFPISNVISTTGALPDGFDPLDYAIESAHARGLALHAWVNPLRVTTGSTDAPAQDMEALPENSPARQHPEWVVAYADGRLYLDPGHPEVRQLVADGVAEILNQYEVDGIHFDDYFYPYPVEGADFDDAVSFETYGGDMPLDDWRRSNINDLILRVHTLAQEKGVPFGVSPFAVWRNQSSDPLGSATAAGVETYCDLYADTRMWVKEGMVDYICPQIYWSFEQEPAPFDTVFDWWADCVRDTQVQLWVGHAFYKQGTDQPGWDDAQQTARQLEYVSANAEYDGSLFFRYGHVKADPGGATAAMVPMLTE